MKKENWSIGKRGHGGIITDNDKGFKESTGHTGDAAIEYYGGALICESVWRKKDAHLISAAPDMLEACVASIAAFEAQGIYGDHPIVGYVYNMLVDAVIKASNNGEFNVETRTNT
jgi:hypothetical protein